MSQYWLCLTSWGCVVLIPQARSAPLNSHASHSMESPVLFNVREENYDIVIRYHCANNIIIVST